MSKVFGFAVGLFPAPYSVPDLIDAGQIWAQLQRLPAADVFQFRP